jgi:hypothetical protein
VPLVFSVSDSLCSLRALSFRVEDGTYPHGLKSLPRAGFSRASRVGVYNTVNTSGKHSFGTLKTVHSAVHRERKSLVK